MLSPSLQHAGSVRRWSRKNLKAPDDTWKVRLIEENFHRLMFEMEGVRA